MNAQFFKKSLMLSFKKKIDVLTIGLLLIILLSLIGLLGLIYLNYLQLSLQNYTQAIAWFTDVIAHPDKIKTLPYLLCCFFFEAHILAYPFVLIISLIMLIAHVPLWKEGDFLFVLFLPALFPGICMIISGIGRALI